MANSFDMGFPSSGENVINLNSKKFQAVLVSCLGVWSTKSTSIKCQVTEVEQEFRDQTADTSRTMNSVQCSRDLRVRYAWAWIKIRKNRHWSSLTNPANFLFTLTEFIAHYFTSYVCSIYHHCYYWCLLKGGVTSKSRKIWRRELRLPAVLESQSRLTHISHQPDTRTASSCSSSSPRYRWSSTGSSSTSNSFTMLGWWSFFRIAISLYTLSRGFTDALILLGAALPATRCHFCVTLSKCKSSIWLINPLARFETITAVMVKSRLCRCYTVHGSAQYCLCLQCLSSSTWQRGKPDSSSFMVFINWWTN